MKRWTVYCHTHIATGKRYIGITSRTVERRWAQHICQAKSSRGGRWHFPNAIRKYGPEAFEPSILEWDLRNPEKGFNLAEGGEHKPHPITDKPWDRPEFRAKALQNLAKANDIPREVRVQRAQKLWQDPEFRERITEANRQAYSNPELVDRVTEAMKEVFSTPESKAKRSRSSKTMWQSENYRAKNAELWQGLEFREKCESGLRHGAVLNAEKTHCPNGHPYIPENTIINSKGSRECLECTRRSKRESARKNRAEKVRIRGPIVVTHCANGHEYLPENTRMTKRGSRMCLFCMRKRSRERARMLRSRSRQEMASTI
jgi:hypothetical protein